LCRKCGISISDLENMTIGDCLDYISEYVESEKPQEEKKRQASQSDFDGF